jgi:hypothetical protein
LQSALTKCWLLQPNLIKIAAKCDRGSRYISTVDGGDSMRALMVLAAVAALGGCAFNAACCR